MVLDDPVDDPPGLEAHIPGASPVFQRDTVRILLLNWVTLRARWVTLRDRWVTLRARWVTLRARRVTLRTRWVMLRARCVTLRARWVTLRASWVFSRGSPSLATNTAGSGPRRHRLIVSRFHRCRRLLCQADQQEEEGVGDVGAGRSVLRPVLRPSR